ncbi:uracil permease [Desulfolutivibrio sulfoxidireducens]|uniref:uracil permease n=1 Tax=Desulfolutivibrio sulfoxidireducens TaxID=2773299 RepID=UPI00159D2987|nr:uracil permease [Desulfolutivibrio sulfoxidireducens]QLA15005.1 uracil permease [Desulfolutivibrio sulfoxidireducens]QLA18572.1 uracil permease [Desulfolutivibrio sulfoxidireducens]
MARKTIQVQEKVPFLQGIPLSFQHLFAMFGASVLVPTLFKIDPAVVLLMNGIGTLIYLVLCKGRAPAFLGSSFAFLSPVFVVLGANQGLWGQNYPLALGGFIASGLIFFAVALVIWKFGPGWIDFVLPPATMGPIVALIGLELASVATGMAGFTPDANGAYDAGGIFVAIVTLCTVAFGSLLFRGFMAVIPVLTGIIVGYVVSIPLGLVHFDRIAAAPILAFPTVYTPIFDINAILIIIPASLVVISEHIGHLVVTGNIVGRDLTRDPGLHRSLMGDGVSTALSGFCGSVPTTTYGENIGVMAITRVYSVWVIGGAAVISIVLAFIGKLSAVIQSIPGPVMGGICILLFGVIAASGIRMLVEAKVDYSKPINLTLTAIVLIVGISGVAVKIGTVELKGMALATVVGMALSLVFHLLERFGLVSGQTDI